MKTITMTPKDIIITDVKTIRSAPPRFKATGFAIEEDANIKTGELREVGYIVAEDHTVYSTVTNTAISIISDIIDAVEGNAINLPIEIGVSLCNSNGGHEFITFSGPTGSQSCFHAIAKI